ncbi:L-fuculose-phosphate aldolase [Saccharopolyspora antimicrobica]|uniref:L-fuculose 1-phosphate aldolase n=1 Tax=Saccharopolyspora antimicrobica TaxID=455193 RepID=A0A1I5H3H9_9PSEU|nr:class II aldolase/adducin family protein [Saccharopolyspora antimicrobica]RKT90118.1 L-fuculose 1-phosphate aldolase [Saccharopolyspora antimicrobica]SFO42779.1 L-fuculose-phosphate aldolase [Saccharopolyspora antimicrobica]
MSSSRLAAQRSEVIAIAQRMTSDRLVVGTSGNVSVRSGDLVAVTPSGVDYDDLQVADIPVVNLDGDVVEGDLKPTSELPMHLTAYREHDAGAVVHTHSLNATALSLLRDEVPAVHYQLADFGGPVRVAEYATFGTPELAQSMSKALTDRTGCILRNHGTVTIADSLPKAYNRARQLEWLCELWLTAKQVGEPSLLSDEEMARCAELFSGYGQQSR